MKARGIDVASCDGVIYGDRILADKRETDPITFVAFRASISYAYPSQEPYLDRWEWFKTYWPLFETVGRVGYHLLYPGEDPQAQLNNHLRVVPPGQKHVRRCIDAELDHGQTRKVITDKCEYIVKGMQDADGFSPLMYGRANWINQFMEYRPWWDEVDWWLAQYLFDRTIEDTREPALPIGVTKYLIHQVCDKFPSNGLTEALELDVDRFNGDATAVRQYFGFEETPAPPDPMEQRVAALETQMQNLNTLMLQVQDDVARSGVAATQTAQSLHEIGELFRARFP